MKERTIFLAALDEGTPAERAAYLDEACGGDAAPAPAGRGAARVPRAGRQLPLEARPPPGRAWRRPAGRIARPPTRRTVDEAVREHPGTVIGPYKLMEQIGEGGMGVVFVAEQQQPVRRKVALKVIKPGMDTRAGHRPLRGRAAGPGADGPPQHRQGPRRRRHRHRAGPTSSWSWSRACPSPSTATEQPAHAARAAGAVRPRLPGGAARPPEGHHPPRPQAVQHPGRRCTTARRWSR